MKSLLFDVQRFSTHDGPGIRTTIFLKGCNLDCFWCHNPESITFEQQLSINRNRCLMCGKCVSECSFNVHRLEDGKHYLDINNCQKCFKCVAACDYDALEIIGYEYEVESLVKDILQDKIFFDVSGGGITLSGGEALIHQDYVFKLLTLLKGHNIHTLIETNGALPIAYYEKVIQLVDMFYVDVKDSLESRLYSNTKADYNTVLNTLEYLNNQKKSIVMVCLIINTINNNVEHYDNLIALYKKFAYVKAIKLINYHEYGNAKLAKLGYPISDTSKYINHDFQAIKQYFLSREVNIID